MTKLGSDEQKLNRGRHLRVIQQWMKTPNNYSEEMKVDLAEPKRKKRILPREIYIVVEKKTTIDAVMHREDYGEVSRGHSTEKKNREGLNLSTTRINCEFQQTGSNRKRYYGKSKPRC